MASRGYFQVSDGFTTSTGVIGRVVSTGVAEVLQDVTADPAFVAATAGLRAEVVRAGAGLRRGRRRGQPRVARGAAAAAVADAEQAAVVLGRRLEALGGLPPPSLAERLAHVAVDLAGQVTVAEVRRRALAGRRSCRA
jgi:hypothetical protein